MFWAPEGRSFSDCEPEVCRRRHIPGVQPPGCIGQAVRRAKRLLDATTVVPTGPEVCSSEGRRHLPTPGNQATEMNCQASLFELAHLLFDVRGRLCRVRALRPSLERSHTCMRTSTKGRGGGALGAWGLCAVGATHRLIRH